MYIALNTFSCINLILTEIIISKCFKDTKICYPNEQNTVNNKNKTLAHCFVFWFYQSRYFFFSHFTAKTKKLTKTSLHKHTKK